MYATLMLYTHDTRCPYCTMVTLNYTEASPLLYFLYATSNPISTTITKTSFCLPVHQHKIYYKVKRSQKYPTTTLVCPLIFKTSKFSVFEVNSLYKNKFLIFLGKFPVYPYVWKNKHLNSLFFLCRSNYGRKRCSVFDVDANAQCERSLSLDR